MGSHCTAGKNNLSAGVKTYEPFIFHGYIFSSKNIILLSPPTCEPSDKDYGNSLQCAILVAQIKLWFLVEKGEKAKRY